MKRSAAIGLGPFSFRGWIGYWEWIWKARIGRRDPSGPAPSSTTVSPGPTQPISRPLWLWRGLTRTSWTSVPYYPTTFMRKEHLYLWLTWKHWLMIIPGAMLIPPHIAWHKKGGAKVGNRLESSSQADRIANQIVLHRWACLLPSVTFPSSLP